MERPRFVAEGYILTFRHPNNNCPERGKNLSIDTYELDSNNLVKFMNQTCGNCGTQLEFSSEAGKHGKWINP